MPAAYTISVISSARMNVQTRIELMLEEDAMRFATGFASSNNAYRSNRE
jgi:hypothetical protein